MSVGVIRRTTVVLVSICGLALAGTSWGQVSKIEHVTVTDDSGAGIVAVIELVPPASSAAREYVGTTGGDGVLQLNPAVDCPQRFRLYVRVEAGRYLPKMEDCQKVNSSFRAKLTSFGILTVLYDGFERAGAKPTNAGVKALVASDLAYRLKGVPTIELESQLIVAKMEGWPKVTTVLQEEVEGRKVEIGLALPKAWSAKALQSAGDYLGVAEPITFDFARKTFIMTPALANAVEKFQFASGIEGTGELDYKTLSALSKSDIGKFLKAEPASTDVPMVR